MYVYGVGSFVCCAKLLQSCLTLLPYGPYPTRVICQWDFPGKNTGVGCHSRDLPDPGIKPASLKSPALADRPFTTSAT